MKLPRFMLCAVSSGCGKTFITCGILQALINRHYKVSAFKCGPDYIDPMFHQSVIKVPSKNIDTFFCDADITSYLFAQQAKKNDISVIEGVMGYYDGLGGVSTKASSYEIASVTKTPAFLIVNGKGMSLSIVALIKGFLLYRKENLIQGVILNQVSPAIYNQLKETIEEQLKIAVVGYVPLLSYHLLKSRHLGLVLPEEVPKLKETIQQVAALLEQTLELERIIEIAHTAPDLQSKTWNLSKLQLERYARSNLKKIKLAVAKDKAFCFFYKDNLNLLEQMGFELIYFSPLHDKQLPEGCFALLLSGGYPELFAEELSRNTSMLQDIYKKLQIGMPCIAECGGFLYLQEQIEDINGTYYNMVSFFSGKAFSQKKLVRFGYVTIKAIEETTFLPKGQIIKGHEFHYWDSTNNGESCLAEKPTGRNQWTCIHATKTIFAGFPHLFYYSNPEIVYQFYQLAKQYKLLQ